MRKTVVMAGILALALATGATRAEAQFRFGANVSWADDTDFGIGARGSFGLGAVGVNTARPVEGLVTFDYFFPDNFDYWELTGNLVYRFLRSETVRATPYAGAGIVYGRTSIDTPGCGATALGCSDSNVGLNLLGGLRFQAANRFIPFVEARLEVKDGSQFIISAGAFFGRW